MKSELAEEIFDVVAARSVAVDRIRFAIKHTEQFAPQTEPMREAELQLLDAQERLEGVDRRFQRDHNFGEQIFSNAEQPTSAGQRRRRHEFTTMTWAVRIN